MIKAMSFTALPSEVSNTITSLETFGSELDIIKELVGNCYDAQAKEIEIFISGFNVLVRDDGNGITFQDRAKVGRFYHTSKLRCTDEIPNTLGLCGRSLASAAMISQNVRLSTKTIGCTGQSWSLNQDPVFETWDTDLSHGTEVFVEGIFESYAPRRREMEAKRDRTASILEYLRFCAVRSFDVDLSMTFNDDLKFSYRSTGVSGRKSAAEKIFECRKVKFEIITYAENGYKLEVIFPTSVPSESSTQSLIDSDADSRFRRLSLQ
jgi:DNA mismatch repair ATPase MutL